MKPQLYIKNSKGRYEPYKEPVPKDDHTIYRKVSGKYKPIGRLIHSEYLTEGVWVVTQNSYSRRHTAGEYLQELYAFDKVADLQYPTIAEVGGLEKILDNIVFDELPEWRQKKLRTGVSEMDCYRYIARRIVELLKKNV